ncbi:MAG: LuxR C-terminal-related transcriptional regulator [Anaerolineae bacterium]
MTLEVPLEQARFRRPPIPSDFAPRARLTRQLNKAPLFPLTIVAAPAGMGKTSAVAGWLDSADVPYVWLTLDAGASLPEAFVRRLIAAVQTRHPEFGLSILAALNALSIPASDLLAGDLALALLRLGEELVIVLDDYELIHDSATQEIVRSLIPLLPAPVHLVIVSRILPPLPLARLRAQGKVLDISADDLRFDREEAQTLLDQVAARPVGAALVDAALSETEGWPFALRLAGLALRGDAHPDTVLAALSATSIGQTIEFLLEEVYSQQPQPIQDMLLKTSILERLTPSLCDAVLGDDTAELTGQAFVEWLTRTNLLLPVDDANGWFRYHSLLRTALEHRLRTILRPREIKTLHERAALWFADHGAVDLVIPHFLAANELEQAVRLVEANLLPLLANEEWFRIEQWLDLLPADCVAINPLLLTCKAWFVFLRQGYGFLPPLFEKIEALLQEPDGERSTWPKPAIEAFLAALACPIEWSTGDVEVALQRAKKARRAVDAVYAPLDGWAALNEGVALHLSGQHDAALDVLNAALADGTRRNEPLMVSRALFGLAYVHSLSGDLVSMEDVGLQMLQVNMKRGLRIGVGWANFVLGLIYYEWNDFDHAKRHFDAILAHRNEVNHLVLRDSICAYALINDLEGRPEAADALLNNLENVAWDTTSLNTLRLLAAFRAQRAARLGDDAGAERYLALARPESETGPMIFSEAPELAQAKILLTRGSKGAAREALEHLTHLEGLARSFSNTRRLIDIQAASALAYARLGLTAEALIRLKEAVALGEPGRFTRTFLDFGPDMARLLGELARRGPASDYVVYLLRQFAASPSLNIVADRVTVRQQHAQSQLIEPLTEREMDVLGLLVQRQSYQEIAQSLVITRATVKAHTVHIYQKLGVSSRREAILVTQRLGLLGGT